MKPRRGEATIVIDAPPDRVFTCIEHVVGGPGFTVIERDPADRRFAYRTTRDDDNPSFAVWTWQVDPAASGGSRVTLAWELRPVTFLRKRLSAIRNRRIARTEAPGLLYALKLRAVSRPAV